MKKVYEVPEEMRKLNTLDLKLKLLGNIKRSFYVYRVDTGSCNGCEIEIFAALTPRWDPERLGFKLAASPRHADIILCTGPLTRMMRYPLIRAYNAAPDPKVVVALGACACSGGIFYDSYAVWGGIGSHLPVDLYIPGCPPHPATIIHGVALAVGVLDQKLKKEVYDNDDGKPPMIEKPVLGTILFERDVYKECGLLMGYYWGRKLYNKYMRIFLPVKDAFDEKSVEASLKSAVEEEEDPRYAECMRIVHQKVYKPWVAALMTGKGAHPIFASRG